MLLPMDTHLMGAESLHRRGQKPPMTQVTNRACLEKEGASKLSGGCRASAFRQPPMAQLPSPGLNNGRNKLANFKRELEQRMNFSAVSTGGTGDVTVPLARQTDPKYPKETNQLY